MQVVSNYVNPHRTLGVEEGATEQQIKRAYRKLALKLHPDINSSPAAHVEFMQMQHAYETLIGRGRGKELDYEHRQHGNSWDFHDWYWKFSTSQRPGQAGAAGQAQPSSREQVESQLAGLKRKAAFRRRQAYRAQHTQQAASTAASAGQAHTQQAASTTTSPHQAQQCQQAASTAASPEATHAAASHVAAASQKAADATWADALHNQKAVPQPATPAAEPRPSHVHIQFEAADQAPAGSAAAKQQGHEQDEAEPLHHAAPRSRISNNSVPLRTRFAALRTSSVLRCAREFMHEARSRHEQALQVRLDRLASHFRIASLRDDHTDAFAAASGSFREADQHLGSWRASHGGLGMRPNPGHGSSPYQHSQHSTAARTAVLEREVQQHNTDATSLEDVVERLESRFSSSDNTAVGDEPADAGPPESTAQHSAADAGMGSAQGPWWEEVVTDGSASTLRAGGEGEARVQSQLMGLKRRAALRKKGQ